jgi:hypothetical protein
VAADFSLTAAERAAADRVECLASAVTIDQYVAALVTAGFADIEVRHTHQVADKLHAAIIRAIEPLLCGKPCRPSPGVGEPLAARGGERQHENQADEDRRETPGHPVGFR